MKYTKNYKFKKPEPNDTRNINDINDSFDLVDTRLKETQDKNTDLQNTFKTLVETGLLEGGIEETLNQMETQYAPQLNEVKTQLQQTAKRSDLVVERERINNIVSHAGDELNNTELLDTRVSSSGKVFATAGEHVRDIGEKTLKDIINANIYNSSGVTISKTCVTGIGGNITWTIDNANYFVSSVLGVGKEKKYNVFVIDDNGIVKNVLHNQLTIVEAGADSLIIKAYNIAANTPLTFTTDSNTTQLRLYTTNGTVLTGGTISTKDSLMLVEDGFSPNKLYTYNTIIDTVKETDNNRITKLEKNDYFAKNCKLITNSGKLINMDGLVVGSNCTITNDYNFKKHGSPSKRIFGTKTGTSYVSLPVNIINWESITVCFYLPYNTYNANSVSGGYIELFLNTLNDYNAYQHFNSLTKWGWNYFKISKSDFGSAPPNKITTLHFKLNARASVIANSSFGDLTLDSIIVDQKIKPTVLLNFDQIWQECIDNGGYQYMFDNNIPGTMFINDWSSQSTSFKNLANRMQDKYGWEMASYGGFSDNQAVNNATDFTIAKTNLALTQNSLVNSFGRLPMSYATTQFVLTPIGECAMLDVGYKMIRGLTGNPIGYFDKESHWVMCDEISDLTYLQIKAKIDDAITYGSCIPLFTHGIKNDTGSTIISTSIPISIFKQVIDYLVQLRNAGSIQILTFEQFYNACIN